MTKFKMTVNLDNAAFTPSRGIELGRILVRVANIVCEQDIVTTGRPVIDINGNTVGEFEITESGE